MYSWISCSKAKIPTISSKRYFILKRKHPTLLIIKTLCRHHNNFLKKIITGTKKRPFPFSSHNNFKVSHETKKSPLQKWLMDQVAKVNKKRILARKNPISFLHFLSPFPLFSLLSTVPIPLILPFHYIRIIVSLPSLFISLISCSLFTLLVLAKKLFCDGIFQTTFFVSVHDWCRCSNSGRKPVMVYWATCSRLSPRFTQNWKIFRHNERRLVLC